VPQVDGFFLPFRRGRRFCLLHSPASRTVDRGAILYIHPFAEEMNKSRRMAAVQARSLAQAGWTVLQVDLFGCGDSEGGFGEADWKIWVGDAVEAATWLRARSGVDPILWGLRIGCLIAAEAAREAKSSAGLLFWQPIASGRQFLRQFLRVKLAGQIIGGDHPERMTTDQLHAQLRSGQPLEIAGYHLSPALASGLDAAELAPSESFGRIAWLEVANDENATLAPASRNRLDAWQSKGIRVHARAVAGPSFWQTQEISESPALIEATTDIVKEWGG